MPKLYWTSWIQPTKDARPLGYPPNKAVLGWWKAGTRLPDKSDVLCALVVGSSPESAKASIKLDWPEAEEWRFIDQVQTTALSDRFEIKPWMHKRMSEFHF